MSRIKKPVLIIQHTPVGHPGAVLPLLDELDVEWERVALNEGDRIPDTITPYSGLILMGGAMSANDDLDWIRAEIQLIQQAYENNIPISGHCLGSQIMSKALGAEVKKNSHKEIGWQAVSPTSSSHVAPWFGELGHAISVFQWHGDTFGLPQGAELLLHSEACPHQAYILNDRHVAMQFHLEMTPELIEVSLEANGKELRLKSDQDQPFVNTVEEIYSGIDLYLERMHEMLRCVYVKWSENLKY